MLVFGSVDVVFFGVELTSTSNQGSWWMCRYWHWELPPEETLGTNFLLTFTTGGNLRPPGGLVRSCVFDMRLFQGLNRSMVWGIRWWDVWCLLLPEFVSHLWLFLYSIHRSYVAWTLCDFFLETHNCSTHENGCGESSQNQSHCSQV